MEDVSDETAQVALQGPKSPEIMARLAREEDIPKKYYSFVEKGSSQVVVNSREFKLDFLAFLLFFFLSGVK